MKYWRVPLDSDMVQITRGLVHIIDDRCKGCGYCIEYCPREVLEFSKSFNAKGYHPPVVKNGECLNCHYCELLCPEFAIFSVPIMDELPVMDELPDRKHSGIAERTQQ